MSREKSERACEGRREEWGEACQGKREERSGGECGGRRAIMLKKNKQKEKNIINNRT